ncbi:hypothetical protein MES5069_620034 [Mesorhizobium escarrei]|uniref:Uncharacterized protein n=1 Tax=Mesorhizobium escarrei TaxID=666018 RepID=A0ABM9EEK4_9HYPH|nr:hypothetical protein MES5069_620034 [Mesorhizobium escarrei]
MRAAWQRLKKSSSYRMTRIQYSGDNPIHTLFSHVQLRTMAWIDSELVYARTASGLGCGDLEHFSQFWTRR